PIVDSQGRIFAVLVGQPPDPTYAAAVERVFQLFKLEGTTTAFSASLCHHRRGLFAMLNIGLSYGKGQTTPSFLHNGKYTSVAERLTANVDVIRMATFASFAFSLWAPRLYAYYCDHQEALHDKKDLPRNFKQSVFSCAAFNFGPRVWTFRHRDVLNVPFGLCTVQSAGPFDHTKGGHMVLWDLKLVIEFPSGALILLPSATIAHSNIPVQEGDERVSFTHFTASGLLRYVDNGFRTETELVEEDPVEYARLSEKKAECWAMGLGMFSTLDEL
ncbi:hypothetical protein C8R44DRAFT_576749, partial [Mycena epipterygia]